VIDDPRFTAAPDLGKLAMDGNWERAVVFHRSQFTSESEVRAYLGQSDEVACEAFFGSAFFGVRVYGPDLARFVVAFADAMGSATSGSEFFQAVEELGVALGTDFRFAELGAEGAWNSVGPFRINDPWAALADTDALWRDLAASPAGRDTHHDKALEFTYAGGATHWLALPVSDAGVISRGMLEESLRTLCG
jgi:hypothetical protein